MMSRWPQQPAGRERAAGPVDRGGARPAPAVVVHPVVVGLERGGSAGPDRSAEGDRRAPGQGRRERRVGPRVGARLRHGVELAGDVVDRGQAAIDALLVDHGQDLLVDRESGQRSLRQLHRSDALGGPARCRWTGASPSCSARCWPAGWTAAGSPPHPRALAGSAAPADNDSAAMVPAASNDAVARRRARRSTRGPSLDPLPSGEYREIRREN